MEYKIDLKLNKNLSNIIDETEVKIGDVLYELVDELKEEYHKDGFSSINIYKAKDSNEHIAIEFNYDMLGYEDYELREKDCTATVVVKAKKQVIYSYCDPNTGEEKTVTKNDKDEWIKL